MATTTNYGWTTPDDTALVKDGASAIRTLGSSVDTTTKALNPSTTLGDIEYRSSTANTNTRLAIGTSGQGLQVVAGVPSWAASSTSTLTTTGDLLYASAANTLARRAIGTTGQVLTVSGGLPTWANAGAAATSFALINTGGTALTGASTITVSGLSGYNKLLVLITDGSSANVSSDFSWRFNADSTASIYKYAQAPSITSGSTYAASNMGAGYTQGDQIYFAKMSASATSTISGGLLIDGANSSGIKIYQSLASGSAGGSNGHQANIISGTYGGTSVISSISVLSTSGNFDNGTLFVYGG